MSNAALAIAAILGILAGVVPVVVGVVLHHFQVVDRRHIVSASLVSSTPDGAEAQEKQAIAA